MLLTFDNDLIPEIVEWHGRQEDLPKMTPRNLRRLFRKYQELYNRGYPVPVDYLEGFMGHWNSVEGIIKSMEREFKLGIPHANPHHFPSWRDKAVDLADGSNFFRRDIAYFLGLSESAVKIKLRDRNPQHRGIEIIRIGKNHLTYQLASRIYQLLALGEPVEAVTTNLRTSPEIVSYARNNRGMLKRVDEYIRDQLREMLVAPDLDTPYVPLRVYHRLEFGES